ncbi:hypothetical protein ACFZCP_38570 [Streptomyces sp. NPDC007971]|uniref:hypothetical protein n=1 Tax=Streptomyces sp. NPDC007971 TaxID=3364799 RepID=UPI0036E01E1F
MSTLPSSLAANFEVRHLSVPLHQPYNQARAHFNELVPVLDQARFEQLKSGEAVVEQVRINAPHHFMRYWEGDVTAAMTGSGSAWKCTSYLMGNHVIAERMYRRDPVAMLYAPLRVVIHEDRTGSARFELDQPSTLFASRRDPEITGVGPELDGYVAALLTALGAGVPAELES